MLNKRYSPFSNASFNRLSLMASTAITSNNVFTILLLSEWVNAERCLTRSRKLPINEQFVDMQINSYLNHF